jgi:hypothetical protein
MAPNDSIDSKKNETRAFERVVIIYFVIDSV